MSTFSENLKELRLSASLTQQSLSDAIGVSKSAIQFWERDINRPNLAGIMALANFFQISTDELIGMDDIAKQNHERPNNELNDEELLLDLFRQLPPDQKYNMIATFEILLNKFGGFLGGNEKNA